MSDTQQNASDANAAAGQNFPDQPPSAVQPCQQQLHWISVGVIDADEDPITQPKYSIKVTDGQEPTGELPDDLRFDSIPAGLCNLDLTKFWDNLRQVASALGGFTGVATAPFEPDPPDFDDDCDDGDDDGDQPDDGNSDDDTPDADSANTGDDGSSGQDSADTNDDSSDGDASGTDG